MALRTFINAFGASINCNRLAGNVKGLQKTVRLLATKGSAAAPQATNEPTFGTTGNLHFRAKGGPCTEREITSQIVNVDGIKFHIDQTGCGKNVLFLLPGAIGSSRTDFLPQLENLNKDMFTVISWDPRGYGRSRPPERDWPLHFIERDAHDAAKLMKELGVQKCSLLGASDGGTTAIIVAARYPSMVNKLVVWGSNAYVSEEDLAFVGAVKDTSKWSKRMREPFVNLYGEELFAKLWSEWVEAYTAYNTHRQGDICKEDLANVQCPTLIIHGQKDTVCPQFHAQYLNEHIKNSRLHYMPDGKHNLHLKYFKEFNSMVESFIIEPPSNL